MDSIVVGYDASRQADDALELAAALGRKLIVAVVDEVQAALGDAHTRRHGREDYFAACFEAARARLGDREFSERTAVGSAPAALDRIVREEGADAIAVGSTHRGRLGRVMPGSVGTRLLAGAPCPVIVAPLGYGEHPHAPVSTIGVGFDGSEQARGALSWTFGLARELDAAVRVIAVTPPGSDRVAGERYGITIRDEFATAVDDAVAALPPGLDVAAVIEEGAAAAVLALRTVELDLIVIGSRGYGPVRSVLLGSVGDELIRTAACPVIVIPKGEAPEPVAAGDAPAEGRARI